MSSSRVEARTELAMNTPVIANEVKQSRTSDGMDCRAALAMTKSLFKFRERYQTGYGWLAMTKSLFKVHVRYRTIFGGLAMTALLNDFKSIPRVSA